MKELIKKSFLLGLGAAAITKKEAEKAVKELIKKNAITLKEGRKMIGKIRSAAEREVKSAVGKLDSASRKQFGKIKKSLNSIDKELSSEGRKTLKKIMKGFSK
ncbi:hypothetical protein HYX01_03060 [Candidatus Woesearchaeota archaeon]|nr:hypothetical protein [Candidatus Woesearchaeota archaeon]